MPRTGAANWRESRHDDHMIADLIGTPCSCGPYDDHARRETMEMIGVVNERTFAFMGARCPRCLFAPKFKQQAQEAYDALE